MFLLLRNAENMTKQKFQKAFRYIFKQLDRQMNEARQIVNARNEAVQLALFALCFIF